MTKPAIRMFVVVYSALAVLAAACAADEKLPVDPRIQTGKLDNGLTWMFRKHGNPPGKMAMLLHVGAGSLNETDTQRGLAHFLQHMAFSGSENFPPGALQPYYETIGMEYGPDLNAFTSFDETVYLLMLPNTTPEVLEQALKVLSDYAFRMSLLPAEIERQRGAVVEELKSSKNVEQRLRDEMFPRLFEGSRFGQRLVRGDETVLKAMLGKEFEDYYRTWYRPDHITLAMVGDADFDALRPVVAKWFGQYKPTAPPRTAPGPEFKPFTRQRALVVKDPEYAGAEVGMISLGAGRPPVTTVEGRRTQLIERMTCWLLQRRLNDRIKDGGASYESAMIGVENFFRDATLANAATTGKPESWSKMLDELLTEINRVREFGFTPGELELAKTEFMTSTERNARAEDTRDAQTILFQMAQAVNEGEPLLSGEQEVALLKRLLPTVQPTDLQAAFNVAFVPGTAAFIMQAPQKDDVKVPSEEEFLAAAQGALARKVEAPAEVKPPKELLAEEPKPGKIAETMREEGLDITHAWLDNGVRVHHRYMDSKKDTVLFSISLAGGQIQETAENAGITGVASLAFNQPATTRLTSAEIADLMTGKNIRVGAGPGEDALVVQISGSPFDLEAGLKLAYALLTDAKLEESALAAWKQQILQRLQMAQSMPEFKAFEALRELLGGGDPRMTLPTVDRVQRLTAAPAQEWLTKLCREAPIEVAVVGDLKWSDAQPLIEKYLGSLNKRPRDATALDSLRKLQRQPGPLEKRVKVPTPTPKAMVFAGFVGCDAGAVDDARLLQLAASVLDARLNKRLREELALVGSIRAINEPALVYVDSGLFMVPAPCEPAKVDDVAKEIVLALHALAESGPSTEELDAARKQILDKLDTDMKEPDYWWGILQGFDLHHVNLLKIKTIQADVAAYTVAQVRDAARKYDTPARAFLTVATPESSGGPGSPGKKDAPTP